MIRISLRQLVSAFEPRPPTSAISAWASPTTTTTCCSSWVSPKHEQWISPEGAEIQFELLRYPARSYTVVMMGASRSESHYIGALHEPSRQILDSAKLANGGSTASMLKNLPKY